MRASLYLAAALAAFSTVADAQIVARSYSSSDDDRAALGINTATSGTKRDTLGLLIVSVVAGSPAEKAGLEEGNRIQSINGVSLRLAAADAGERDMDGVMTRRLIRELRKINPGDEVDLRVYAAGQTKTVKFKTTDVEELSDLERRATRGSEVDSDERAVIGLAFGGGGSARDTLGVFVASVVEGGPAEKAGIFEGARIAAINGTDLRVAREDAGDMHLANSKANRFRRVMRGIKAGEVVELRVYSNGQFRTVRVTTDEYEDVYTRGRGGSFHFSEIMPGFEFRFPRVEVTPAPRAPRAPMLAPGRVHIMAPDELPDDALRQAEDALRRTEEAMRRTETELQRRTREAERRTDAALRRAREAMTRAYTRTVSM